MTSFAIIAETAPKVNLKMSNNGTFPSLVPTYTPTTIIAASRCEPFDSGSHATNQWHGGAVATSTTSAVAGTSPSLASSDLNELRDFDLDSDPSLPLTAEQVLFCTSQLGALGCSNAEMEQFFDGLLVISPYWYPNFRKEAAKYEKSPAFLSDVCDAFVYSITPCDDYVRLAGQLFHYQRDGAGYEFITCMGSSGGEVVELVVYPHEVQQVKQELAWA